MKYEKNGVLTLSNNNDYYIIETLKHDDNEYLYLTGIDDKTLSIVKVINKDGNVELSKLDDNEFIQVRDLFAEKIAKDNGILEENN